MTSAREAFCRGFEAKLQDAGSVCLATRGRRQVEGVPDCLGRHVRAAKNRSVGYLYAVYWGARCGVLTEAQAEAAMPPLLALPTTQDPGLVFCPNASPETCILYKYGLEVLAGCLQSDPVVMANGRMVSARALVKDDNEAWLVCKELPLGALAFEHPSAVGLPSKSYSYIKITLGNFVASDGDEIPVSARLCKSGNDRWIEYRDRTSRWARYPCVGCADCGKGGSNALLALLLLDARGELYSADRGEVKHRLCGADGIPRYVAKSMKRAGQAAASLGQAELVAVSMPQPADRPCADLNLALIDACWRAAAPGAAM
jgi:hypothetical protein